MCLCGLGKTETLIEDSEGRRGGTCNIYSIGILYGVCVIIKFFVESLWLMTVDFDIWCQLIIYD